MSTHKKRPSCTSALLTVSIALGELPDQGTETFFTCVGVALIIFALAALLGKVAKIVKQFRKIGGSESRSNRTHHDQEPDVLPLVGSDKAPTAPRLVRSRKAKAKQRGSRYQRRRR